MFEYSLSLSSLFLSASLFFYHIPKSNTTNKRRLNTRQELSEENQRMNQSKNGEKNLLKKKNHNSILKKNKIKWQKLIENLSKMILIAFVQWMFSFDNSQILSGNAIDISLYIFPCYICLTSIDFKYSNFSLLFLKRSLRIINCG